MNIELSQYKINKEILETVENDMGWRRSIYLKEVYDQELSRRQSILHTYTNTQSEIWGNNAPLYKRGVSLAYCLSLDPTYFRKPPKINNTDIDVMMQNKIDLGITSTQIALSLINISDPLKRLIGTLIDLEEDSAGQNAFLEGFGDVGMLVHSKLEAVTYEKNPAFKSFTKRFPFL